MIEIRILRAEDASFANCFSIRQEVFVLEQGVAPDEERDSYDETAIHFLAVADGTPAGTARVILKDDGATAKIGRVAVRKPFRGLGLGRSLIRAVEAAPQLGDVASFMLDAQTHALAFYAGLGYAASGPEFLDAGIPHRRMTKPANRD